MPRRHTPAACAAAGPSSAIMQAGFIEQPLIHICIEIASASMAAAPSSSLRSYRSILCGRALGELACHSSQSGHRR